MANTFTPRVLGKTGFMAGPLGVGSSYGVGARGIEEAFERGVNYFYWAWARRQGMRKGLRNICRKNREKVFISITSLVPTGPMIRFSVTRVLRALQTDYVDGLLFFLFKNRPLFKSQIEPALRLKEQGLVRHIGFSSHHRPNFPRFAKEPHIDIEHIRYNAIHRGAETEVFPHLPPKGSKERPGVVIFTATSWRQIITADPKKLAGLKIPTAGDCYRFVLSHPDVDVCLTGPSNDNEMRHALDAIEKGPMTEDELNWMRAVGTAIKK